MADAIRWNVDEMSRIHSDIADKLSELESSRTILANIDKITEYAWKGSAAGVYNMKLDMDMRIYDLMLKELRELNDDLGRIVTNCYGRCEEEIRNELVSLEKNMR